jgi:putative lipoprotein
MKRFLALVAVVVVISTAVGVALVVRQRRRLGRMSDDELRAVLEDKIGKKVSPEQLALIQDAVVAKVRGSRWSSSGAVTGSVTYSEQIPMPPDAVVIVELLDTSRLDAPAEQIGAHVIDDPRSVPLSYSIGFDPAEIVESHGYSIRATISADDRLLWTTDTNYPVITRDNPTTVDLLLVAATEPVSE